MLDYGSNMKLLESYYTASEMRAGICAAARARRIAMNLTQGELSARSGVPVATLKRFEAGRAASLDTVLALAEALGSLVEFADLFPLPDMRSLEEVERVTKGRQRVRKRGP